MTAPVTTERVRFRAGASTFVGDLHRPADSSAGPAVVVTGSWTTVKEQMADRYARLLAAQGFAALSFDFTGFGESGGDPRDVESPALKARDIGDAVTFLAEHPAVDPARIGALAICASAGYTALNAVGDDRVRCLALIASWLHDADLVREMYGGENGVAERVNAGHARSRYDQTGIVDYVPAQSATDPKAAMPMAIDQPATVSDAVDRARAHLGRYLR